MTRILFVCLGNICRSPMAEYVMKDLTSKAGLSEQFEIASAATSAWEIGNPVYPPARQKLVKSISGRIQKHIATAESLGLRKIGQETIQPDNEQTRGKIAKIGYLLEVTEVE